MTDLAGTEDDDLPRKAAKWDRIAAAWETYCTKGAAAFDWDYASRDLMDELTADQGDPGARQVRDEVWRA